MRITYYMDGEKEWNKRVVQLTIKKKTEKTDKHLSVITQ